MGFKVMSMKIVVMMKMMLVMMTMMKKTFWWLCMHAVVLPSLSCTSWSGYVLTLFGYSLASHKIEICELSC